MGGSGTVGGGSLGCGLFTDHGGTQVISVFDAVNDAPGAHAEIPFPAGVSAGTPYAISARADVGAACAIAGAGAANLTAAARGSFGGVGVSGGSARFDSVVIYALGPP